MAHNITFEQLKALGFEGTEKAFTTGDDLEFRQCGFVDRVFVSRAAVAVGTYHEAIDFEGVENEHDLKTLIMLLYGEKRQTIDHRS